MKLFLLILISALLLILSFPRCDLEFLAWFALVPLFFALRDKKPIYGFFLSYLYGLIFFAGITYWLINVTCLGFILLILYLALYFGIFGFIIIKSRRSSMGPYSLVFIPAVWVTLEYIRSHLFTGFGWALLGYSQYLNLPIIQIANLTGVWGVSFLVIMVNVWVYVLFRSQSLAIATKSRILSSLLVILSLFLSLSYGFYQISHRSKLKELAPVKISIIQGNIPQAIKWQESAKGIILEEYLRLSKLAVLDNPDLIVWPEAALPEIMEHDLYFEDNVKSFLQNIDIPLLLGAISLEEKDYYNNAILISKQGNLVQRYDKLHLVPFGEYIPFKKALPFLETIVPIGDFTAGQDYTVFLLDRNRDSTINESISNKDVQSNIKTRFSVLICFEDIFPELSRQFVKRGAGFLINITNDAWFGITSSPYQHLQASVFRAVENRVYLVRAANTGISGFITPEGKVYPLVDNTSGRQIFISGYKTKDILPVLEQKSIYTQWGDWFVLVCFLACIYGFLKVK